MLISIVVPIYNKEQYLKKCIDSVISQEFEDYELILVNDGSTDNSLSICNEYKNAYKQIKIVNKQNGGLVSARKAGANVASGEYVLPLDADDSLGQNVLRRVKEIIEKYNCDCLQYGMQVEQGDSLSKQVGPLKNGFYDKHFIKENIVSKYFSSTELSRSVWKNVIKRDLYLKCQNNVPDSISNGEDYVFCYYLYNEIQNLYVDDSVSYIYNLNDDSMTHQNSKKVLDNIDKLTCFLLENINDVDKEYVVNNYYKSVLDCIIQETKNNKYDQNYKNMMNQLLIQTNKYEEAPIYLSSNFRRIYCLFKNKKYFMVYILIKLYCWIKGI